MYLNIFPHTKRHLCNSADNHAFLTQMPFIPKKDKTVCENPN